MCLTRAELERLQQSEEEPTREKREQERGKAEEVERFERMPSSLPHDTSSPPKEPELAPA